MKMICGRITIGFLGTHYLNGAVVWFCENLLNNISSQSVWVLSREPELSAAGVNVVDRHLQRNQVWPTEQDANFINVELYTILNEVCFFFEKLYDKYLKYSNKNKAFTCLFKNAIHNLNFV